MNALVFRYKRLLKQELTGEIDAVRAPQKKNIPVVLSRDEVAAVIAIINGIPSLVTQLLYGCGLRIIEALRLRVHDSFWAYNSRKSYLFIRLSNSLALGSCFNNSAQNSF